MIRLLANLVVIILVSLFPWWVACLALIIFLAVFDFVEIIGYGAVLDALYGIPSSYVYGYGFTIISVALYLLSSIIRPYFKQV